MSRRPGRAGGTAVFLFRSPARRRALDQLHGRTVNFQVPAEDVTRANGWQIDSYGSPLPGEPPGDPVPGGPWEVARRLIETYEFADPRIIKAVYHREQPLLHRDMLLVGRFYGLRFHIGVRVDGVIDSTLDLDGRQVRSWGWAYRTLEGHLEMGEMTYQVWKWLDTGEVEFRIDRYMKPARSMNVVLRLGWALFGRWMQVRFVRRSQRRMRKLVERQLAGDVPPEAPRPVDVRDLDASEQ